MFAYLFNLLVALAFETLPVAPLIESVRLFSRPLSGALF